MSAHLDLDESEPAVATDGVWLTCIECGETFAPFADIRYTCDDCDGLLEVRYADLPTWDDFGAGGSPESGPYGVWRYSAGLPFEEGVSLPEGGTPLHYVPSIEEEVGVNNLRIKHEGMNPTGSFKDRGMTVGVRVAKEVGVDRSVAPHALIGQQLAEKATTPVAIEANVENDAIGVREILIRHDSPLHGVRIDESPVPEHPNLTLVAGWFDGELRRARLHSDRHDRKRP